MGNVGRAAAYGIYPCIAPGDCNPWRRPGHRIPARHDLARRIDAGHLGRLVAEHRMDLDEATETAVDLAYHLPRAAYPEPAR